MTFKKRLGFIVVTLACGVPQAAHASSITLQTTVHPIRIVIVDKKGTIQSITSNTSDNVAPQVRRGSLSGPAVTMTAELRAAYDYRIRQADTSRPGVLYTRAAQGSKLYESVVAAFRQIRF